MKESSYTALAQAKVAVLKVEFTYLFTILNFANFRELWSLYSPLSKSPCHSVSINTMTVGRLAGLLKY